MARRIPIAGIYKITSPSNRVYIGQSVDLVTRLAVYKRLNCKGQVKLYNSLMKYGVDNHKFEIICQCEESELNDLEIYYEQLHNSTDAKGGLNMKGGGNKPKMPEEIKLKISKSHIGIGHSEETKARLRITSTGNKNCLGRKMPEETRQKLRDINLGTTRAPQWVKKAADARRGYKHKPESIVKIRESNLGKKRSDEARRNISIAHLGIKQSPELVEKRVQNLKKPILNIQTGIFYYGNKEAAATIGMSHRTFAAKMNGNLKNDTSFIYV